MSKLLARPPEMSLIQEAIHFQSTTFFGELVEALGKIREASLTKLSDEAFFKHALVKKITDMLQTRTGLRIVFDAESSEYGPGIMVAPTTEKHIFHTMDAYRQQYAKSYTLKMSDIVKKNVFVGIIDLKKGVVTGDFSEMLTFLLIPRSTLSYGTVYGTAVLTSEEVAAIIMHELGHAFTAFEYLNRTATTNQVLAQLAEAHSQGADVFGVVLEKYATTCDAPPDAKKALMKAKTIESVACVIYGAEIENCYSQLGASVFDVTSCEQLADQFAVRMGAGRYLAIALDKIPMDRKLKGSARLNSAVHVFSILLTLQVPPMTVFVLFLTAFAVLNVNRNDIYGDLESRLSRIRADLVEQLKRDTFGPKARQTILDDIKIVEDLMAEEESTLTLVEGIAYYLRPGYRNAYKYEMLQRQLEQLGANGLFVKAEQLKVLAAKK